MHWTAFSFWWSDKPVALAIDALVLPIPVLLLTIPICDKPSGGDFYTEVLQVPKFATLRWHLQICRYTIQTATITQLYGLMSFGLVRFPAVPYSISCEITETIFEGHNFYAKTFTKGVNLFLLLPYPACAIKAFNDAILLLKICSVAECKRTNLSGLWLRLFLQAGFPGWKKPCPI